LKIDKYLTEGEVVDKTYALNGYDIHATNKRLFVSSFNGRYVADFDYNHISSLVFNIKRYYWLVVVGIMVLVASLYFFSPPTRLNDNPIIWAGIAAGIASIALGILKRKEYMRIFVIGVSDRVEFSGKRSNLDDLFRTIRQKKEESQTSASNVEGKPKP